ncbi:MAG: bifunctional chorismate mutase/prephenate dehydratase [Clostridiales bacterium]|nr:bifunctional chorismate mutase/prephenate dehydratase [Clostridiales bacterium]
MNQDMKKDSIIKLDQELIQLFCKRWKLIDAMTDGCRKEEKNGSSGNHWVESSFYTSEEEEKLLMNSAAGEEDEFSRAAVKEILDQIMTVTRKRQYARLGGSVDCSLQPVDVLPTDQARVVFQGVEGAYSHQATRLFFGKDVSARAVPTFESAVAAIAGGEADYAVLPIENTTGGAIGDVLDLQMKYECYVVADLNLPIQHALLGVPGSSLDQVKTVFSHPQGLIQCRDYLEKHPGWERIALSNTAVSAKKVLEDGDCHQAAIASEVAGELYGLEILDKGISDNLRNTTRFIVATGKKIYRKDAGKVSLCFECRHSTGTLYHLLSNFTFNGLNMTKIESRPIPERNFEYRFFVEFEGNLQDPAVQNALSGVQREALICRILGNF